MPTVFRQFKSLQYDGTNASAVLAMLNVPNTVYALTSADATQMTFYEVNFPISTFQAFKDQWVVLNPQNPQNMEGIYQHAEYMQIYLNTTDLGALMPAWNAMGIAVIPTLLLNQSANVAVTIKPTLPSTDYSVAAITLSGLNVISTLSVQSIAKTSGSVATVTVKNTGLASLGGQCIVTAVMNT